MCTWRDHDRELTWGLNYKIFCFSYFSGMEFRLTSHGSTLCQYGFTSTCYLNTTSNASLPAAVTLLRKMLSWTVIAASPEAE